MNDTFHHPCILSPQLQVKTQGTFFFSNNVCARAHKCLCAPIFQEIWHNFCQNSSEIFIEEVNSFTLQIGNVSVPNAPLHGFELNVSPNGVCISASDQSNLIYGFFSLLERIYPISTEENQEKFSIDCATVQDAAYLKTRMLHLCVFPETTLPFLQKMMRFAAFMRYTHVVVEFWGTFQYQTLKELSWSTAYTKEQLQPIFNEARMLGLEIVPMINHWGHATASRVGYGKHVVLDQNPKLATLFDITGWNWNITNLEVKKLLKSMRQEVIDLCGEGEYFHIGCDEAYGALSSQDCLNAIQFINETATDLKKHNRKTIMWGDMLLCHSSIENKTKNIYTCFCENQERQQILFNALSKDVIIADWQYDAPAYPIETSIFFKDNGFQTLCCPWHNHSNAIAAAKTAIEYQLHGIMHTTWHTLSTGIDKVATAAIAAWQGAKNVPQFYGYHFAYLAALLRKLAPANGIYENAGWTKKQIQEYL